MMNFMRILARLGFSVGAEQEFHQPQDGYEPLREVKYFRQIVTADSRNSRTLMWDADTRIDNIKLEYRMIGDDAAGFGNVVVDFFGDKFIYSSALANLKPESLYQYRVVAGDKATDWRNLRTAGDGEFEMLVFSDSQCIDYNVWRRTAEAADKNFPDAEIFVVNGDMVDNGASTRQWKAWYEAAANLLRERIFVPVIGNHECYGLDWMDCLPTGYLHNFKVPSNGVKNFGGYFYSFDYGAAHFTVLNTQFMEIEKFNAGLADAQEYWFRRDIANANRPWRIVFMHKSIYNRAQNDFVEEARDYFLRLFDELEIDLVLTGHLHTYRNGGKIFGQKKSERGTHYVLCGRSGDQNYTHEPESYLALKINAESVTLTCKSATGETLDKFTLVKA